MKLTEEQEEKVRHYVEGQELKLKTLRDDVIDHLYCVLESELGKKGKAFDQVLHDAMAELAPNGILDLERKTLYLLNAKRIIIMKKLMFIISCLISVTVAFGILARIIHWPGAAEAISVTYLLSAILVALFAFDRYKVAIARSMSERLTVIIGAAAIILTIIGGGFKMLHLPGAGIMLGVGMTAFFAALPMLFFTIYKRSAV